jgi:hypothetical protein
MSCANAGKHWRRSEGICKLMLALGENLLRMAAPNGSAISTYRAS